MTVYTTTFDNGLRVATDYMPDAESVVIGAWVGVGTRHEPWSAGGLAHLAEHMMFKGTRQRSAYAISAAIERSGGAMNAHTTREETAYYARMMPEDAGLAADIIADMLQRSVFNTKELERERQVIIQEIDHDRDTPEEHVFDMMHRVAFPRQRMGRSILGSEDVISRMPRRQLTHYVRQHYHAGNIVIIGSGRITHDELTAMAQQHFSRLPAGKPSRHRLATVGSGSVFKVKDSEQLHLVIAYPAPGQYARDVHPATLLGIILGGSSTSRLFYKVREKRGLVYSISAGHTAFRDVGLLSVYAGTAPDSVKELIPLICRELRDVTTHITPSELKLAKAQLRSEILMGQESVMRRAEALGHDMLNYGKPIAIEQTLKRIMAVTPERVQRAAATILSQKPILAVLGPHGDLTPYEEITSRLMG